MSDISLRRTNPDPPNDTAFRFDASSRSGAAGAATASTPIKTDAGPTASARADTATPPTAGESQLICSQKRSYGAELFATANQAPSSDAPVRGERLGAAAPYYDALRLMNPPTQARSEPLGELAESLECRDPELEQCSPAPDQCHATGAVASKSTPAAAKPAATDAAAVQQEQSNQVQAVTEAVTKAIVEKLRSGQDQGQMSLEVAAAVKTPYGTFEVTADGSLGVGQDAYGQPQLTGSGTFTASLQAGTGVGLVAEVSASFDATPSGKVAMSVQGCVYGRVGADERMQTVELAAYVDVGVCLEARDSNEGPLELELTANARSGYAFTVDGMGWSMEAQKSWPLRSFEVKQDWLPNRL